MMLNINRYPKTNNNSLVAWNSADEYLLSYFEQMNLAKPNILLQGDRFGFLACNLNSYNPTSVIAYKSQEKALMQNIDSNALTIDESDLINPLDNPTKLIDIALLKVPKSLGLFKLYLYQISKNTNKDTIVVASFMTKHFSKQLLSIASEFFEDVQQSLAKKKARLLILKNPKQFEEKSIISSIKLGEEEEIRQYFGVFSAKIVDYATQFLIDSIKLNNKETRILDLASGNGIIAYNILKDYKENGWQTPEMHLLEDSFLAVESAKFNLQTNNEFHHYNDSLELFDDKYFDLIVTNPPFHFEYELNTEISVGFFKQAHRCLNTGGRFQLVFNRHLNYKPLLRRVFKRVNLVAENSKFTVLECLSDN